MLWNSREVVSFFDPAYKRGHTIWIRLSKCQGQLKSFEKAKVTHFFATNNFHSTIISSN